MNKAIKYISIALLAVVISIIGINRMPQLITIFALACGCVFFIMRKIEGTMRTRLSALFLIAFLIQIVLSLFMYDSTVDTKYYGFSYKGDDYVYGDFGTIVGNLWRERIFPSLNKLTYYNLIGKPIGNANIQYYQIYNAVIFYLFGSCGGQILLIINCFFHVAIIVPVYFICKDLGLKDKTITFISVLFLFWPSTFYWGMINFKEPIVLFVIFAMFALLINMRKKIAIKDLLIFVLLLFVLNSLKTHFSIIFIATMFLTFFIFYQGRNKNIFILAIILAILLRKLMIGPFLANLYIKLPRIPWELCMLRLTSAINDSRTGYFTYLFTYTYKGTLLYMPFGIVSSLFLPFLLRPFTIAQIGANTESIFWWCLMPFLIRGVWVAARLKLRNSFPILATFFIWLGILALTQANMGTLIRQKALLYYTGFIFIGVALDHLEEVKKKLR